MLYCKTLRHAYQMNFYLLVHFKILFHQRFYHKNSFVLRKVNKTFSFCLPFYFVLIWIVYSQCCMIFISINPITIGHHRIHLFTSSQIISDKIPTNVTLEVIGCRKSNRNLSYIICYVTVLLPDLCQQMSEFVNNWVECVNGWTSAILKYQTK